MKIDQETLRKIAKLGVILIAATSMSACAREMSWKEEVLLHDGQVIVAERFYNLGVYPTLESRERSVVDHTVTFGLPSTSKKIVWKTDFGDAGPEPNSLNLIIFGVVKSVPYIAAYPAGCIAYNKWKRPNPPQILFRYEGDQWKRITLEEFPAELVKANVIVGRPATSLLKSFYTVDQVNEENNGIDTPEYRTILREPVKPGSVVGSSVNCEVTIRYKCGWGAPGEFNRKYFERTCK